MLYTRTYIKIHAQITYDRFVLELGDSIEAQFVIYPLASRMGFAIAKSYCSMLSVLPRLTDQQCITLVSYFSRYK